MSDIAVRNEIVRLKLCFAELSRLTDIRPVDWRKQYVALRRVANDCLVRMAANVAQLQDGTTVRPLVIRLNHLVSLHQAEWPVVSIDLDDPSYTSSCERISSTIEQIADAMRQLRRAA